MTINKAIKKILWRVTGNGWTATEDDITAINSIIDYINMENASHTLNNELEFKLYVISFMDSLIIQNTSVFDPIHQKEFHKRIGRSKECIIDDLRKLLNNIAQNQIIADRDISTEHPMTVSDEINKKDLIKLNDAIKNPIEKAMLFGDVWSFKKVIINMTNMYNQFKEDYYD
ncbi:hypothetical protein [Gelidibacter sp. F63206]|uniref:hypothetical protein n=1 Tax=Gelidibacter sp. F63206 TaxID=2926425 RepID=UPI001FF2791C|nr:hypothetical protein [Gelidibacter sp. F63206]MCK0114978.1 hypothetical protein [Gelidibacter sp. F63206]